MATFFGRPVNALLKDVGEAALLGGVMGAASGYWHASKDDEDNPAGKAVKTAASWALADAVIEGGLGIMAPNLRQGSLLRTTLIEGAVGAGTGFAEGVVSAKWNDEPDAFHEGLRQAMFGAVSDASMEVARKAIFPALRAQFF